MALISFPSEAIEKKRLLELFAIGITTAILIGLSRLETQLFLLSETLAKNQDFLTTIVYFGLININVILVLILSFLLFRNVAKLVIERKRGVLGSNLRTKLVVTLVFFALAPTVLFFYISSNFIIQSFDEWFSEKVRDTMQQTQEIGATVYKQDQRRLESLARIALQRIQVNVADVPLSIDPNFIDPSALKGFETEYGLDNILVYDSESKLIWNSRNNPDGSTPVMPDHFVVEAIAKFKERPSMYVRSTVKEEGLRDVVKGVAPIVNPITKEVIGAVVTETRFETQILKSIKSIQKSFADSRPGAKLIKLSYLILLILISVIILFSAVWLGFYVARGITRPIQNLAEATREVALGNYDINLTAKTDDEAGQLVHAFNLMTKDLQSHRQEAEESRSALLTSNEELDQRRKYMEIILKNISAGVVSVDSNFFVTSVNHAAARLLGIQAQDVLGRTIQDGFSKKLLENFWNPLLEQLTSRLNVSSQFIITKDQDEITLLADAVTIVDENQESQGFVLVFNDATERLRAQRAVAWKEVARRIAHEIKNPITPIKLSAQRLLRRFDNTFEDKDKEIFEDCVETILKQVDSLRDLVNEFSKFSRLPDIKPKRQDLIKVLRDALKLFELSYPEIKFDKSHLNNLPELFIDEDQMNRVFVNIISNSIAAIGEQGGEIQLTSYEVKNMNMIRVEIADNGPGIPPHLRGRVLEPYYSTKNEGTGLGLAIVNQIVSDHGGYLRVKSNAPRGAKIVVELPLRNEA